RVHAAGEVVCQRVVDHAVAIEPALAGEGFRHDIDAEVGLASRSVTGVAVMLVRLVDHFDAVGRESCLQLPCDIVLHEHTRRVAPWTDARQRRKRRVREGRTGGYEKIVKTFRNNSTRSHGLSDVKT